MSKRLVSKQEMLQLRHAFVTVYPNCFVPKGATKRPLKIGIKKDMLDRARKDFPGLSHRHVRAFLTDYTSGMHYFQCCREGCARVDLDGTFSGFVTAREAAFSADCLAMIEAGRNPLRHRFPKEPQQIGVIPPSIGDALKLSYPEWAKQNRGTIVAGSPATTPTGAFVTSATDQPYAISDQGNLNAVLLRLEAAQYAASMSNSRYYTDGSKARDDAEIAEVRRQIAAGEP